MKKIFLFALFAFYISYSFAQREGNVWMLGNYGLDFNSDTPVVITSADGFGGISMEGTASVSDVEGNLLFYSDGDSVYNREHEPMPAGRGIVPGLQCWSNTQACAIVPVPGSNGRYYIFSLGYEIVSDGAFRGSLLYYNIVDMAMDGSRGDLATAGSPVYIADSLSEKMTVVRRDCTSTWLIVYDIYSNEFYAYLITPTGISSPVVSPSGISSGLDWAGDIRFSNNKTMLTASSTGGVSLVLYDFSIHTGVLDNPRILDSAGASTGIYSSCFSPDDSKLYTASFSELSQFNLDYTSTEDIIASKQMLGAISGLPTVKLGPDKKIYVNNAYEIGAVNNPDTAGLACDYVPGILDFGDDYIYGCFPNATIPSPVYTDTILVSSDTAICSEAVLHGRSYVDNYIWNTGDTTGHISVDTPGTYYVTSYDNCNYFADTFHVSIGGLYPPVITTRDTALCRVGGAVMLSAMVDSTVGATYHWEPAYAVISGGDSPAALVDPTLASVFYITVTNSLGFCEESATDSIVVNMFSSAPTIITPDTTICAGDSIMLTAVLPIGGYTGHWSPESGLSSPDSTTTWMSGTGTISYVFTSSLRPCYSNDTIHITVEPVPVVYAGSDTMLCDYDHLELSPVVTPADFAFYSYEWLPGTYLSDPHIASPELHAPAGYNDMLHLQVSTPAGCSGSDSFSISVATFRFMEVSTHDTGMCAPVSLQLAAYNALSYLWLPEDGLSDNTSATPVATPDYSTNYLVMGTSAEGCIDSQYVLVQVYPDATIELPDSVYIDMGDAYLIKPGGDGVTFRWSPPEGLNATDIPTPLASPDTPTRYYCIATNEYGCRTTDSIDIFINSILDLPNAFAPGSGNNGIFKVLVWGSATLKSFMIFNRWGNKVFETTDIHQGWDGTYNGTPQPVGVYVYMVEAVTNTGKPFVKQGNVMLLR